MANNSKKPANSSKSIADKGSYSPLPLLGALAGAAAATVAAILYKRRNSADSPASGHPAPDLERPDHPTFSDRADPHFRPNIDAPMSSEDRQALAPATLPNV